MNKPEVLALLKQMADHMRYMHGLLAETEYGDLEDYHWHREAMRLQALAGELLSER